MRKLILMVSALAICHGAFAGPKLIKKVPASKNGIVIPYEHYQLDNGLHIILHEDKSDPIVHVDVTYHVGSAREEIGKSGFAHFFEHMMFQGSDNVGDEQHFKIISNAGGTLNGTTNRDRTNYFETVPSNQLETMLWLEADRMGFLLDAVTQEKFEIQRATVKNERGQNYDNRPYGLAYELSSKTLYPYGHPYSWLTIGYIEDLNRVNVNDLKNFFLRWYGPNNAVITVGGDIDIPQTLKWIEKYFGSIPRGPEVKDMNPMLVKLDKVRYASYVDNYAKQPMVTINFPTVNFYHKDEASLDALADILSEGKSSIIYNRFVKGGLATSAYASHPCAELSGEFTFSFMPLPGVTLKQLYDTLMVVLDEVAKKGFTEDEVDLFRSKHVNSVIYSMENVSNKVSMLASYMTFRKDPNYIGKDLQRYKDLKVADVAQAFKQYIYQKPHVVTSVLTKAGEAPVAPDNYVASDKGYVAPDYGYDGLKYVKAKDTFDRSIQPKSGPNPVIKVPAIQRTTVGSNVDLITTPNDEIPVTVMQLSIPGGRVWQQNYPQLQGLLTVFVAMMNEDTKKYSADSIEKVLSRISSDVSFSASRDQFTWSIRTLNEHLSTTVDILKERMLNPVFLQEELDIVKKRIVQAIKSSEGRPANVASNVYNTILYGDNVLGWSSLGTVESIEKITLDDLNKFYNDYISAERIQVIAVSSVSKDEIKKQLAFLSAFKSKKHVLPVVKPATKHKKGVVYVVDVPNAAQTEFRIGNINDLKIDYNGNYFKSTVYNFALGGSFNSRLNLALREEKGWTYGARSGFGGNEDFGYYTFSGGIKADATDSALNLVHQILTNFKQNGLTNEELAFAQNSMGQSEARMYESGYQRLGFISQMLKYKFPEQYTTQQNQLLSKLTVEELNVLAKKYIPSKDEMYILLVGDKEKHISKLAQQGWEIVELDRQGNIK